jgi:hypothetical protein
MIDPTRTAGSFVMPTPVVRGLGITGRVWFIGTPATGLSCVEQLAPQDGRDYDTGVFAPSDTEGGLAIDGAVLRNGSAPQWDVARKHGVMTQARSARRRWP